MDQTQTPLRGSWMLHQNREDVLVPPFLREVRDPGVPSVRATKREEAGLGLPK